MSYVVNALDHPPYVSRRLANLKHHSGKLGKEKCEPQSVDTDFAPAEGSICNNFARFEPHCENSLASFLRSGYYAVNPMATLSQDATRL